MDENDTKWKSYQMGSKMFSNKTITETKQSNLRVRSIGGVEVVGKVILQRRKMNNSTL